MKIQRHGSIEPAACRPLRGVWPTCYGYFRDRNPSSAELANVWEQMMRFCEANELYLARIFHDFDAEPTEVDHPSFRKVKLHAGKSDTHAVLVTDLEFVREPSAALVTIVQALSGFPGVHIQCFVDERAFDALSE